jgi:hypothetical protein
VLLSADKGIVFHRFVATLRGFTFRKSGLSVKASPGRLSSARFIILAPRIFRRCSNDSSGLFTHWWKQAAPRIDHDSPSAGPGNVIIKNRDKLLHKFTLLESMRDSIWAEASNKQRSFFWMHRDKSQSSETACSMTCDFFLMRLAQIALSLHSGVRAQRFVARQA